jgi:hypothetical protein
MGVMGLKLLSWKPNLECLLYRVDHLLLDREAAAILSAAVSGETGNGPPCSGNDPPLRRFETWKCRLRIGAHNSRNMTFDCMQIFMAFVSEKISARLTATYPLVTVGAHWQLNCCGDERGHAATKQFLVPATCFLSVRNELRRDSKCMCSSA